MISVIVPVYNVEKYLEGCVRSILAQTYGELEVILVNDGSTDSSLSICHALAAEDSRIRVLDGPNGGVSSARNRGLDAAQGEYVAFIDSDDTIHPEMFQRLLDAMESVDADIAECGLIHIPEDGSPKRMDSLGSAVAGDTKECIRKFAFFENTVNGPCNKLYRRSVIGSTRFQKYVQGEDALFNLNVLFSCRRKITIPDCLYFYLRRNGSSTYRTAAGHERDVIVAWNEIGRRLDSVSADYGREAWKKTHSVIQRQFREVLDNHPENWRKTCSLMKKDYISNFPRQFTAENPMTTRQKLGFALFRLSPRLYFRMKIG